MQRIVTVRKKVTEYTGVLKRLLCGRNLVHYIPTWAYIVIFTRII
jgi:hypothetical protein